MTANVNKVIIQGHLGADPELNTTQGGMSYTRISLATTDRRKDKAGNPKEKTEWHRVTLFGKQAETAAEHLKKGDSVYIEGRLSYGSYEKDGVKHYTTDILVNEFKFNSSKRDGDNAAPAQTSAPPAQQAPQADFDEDDIPF